MLLYIREVGHDLQQELESFRLDKIKAVTNLSRSARIHALLFLNASSSVELRFHFPLLDFGSPLELVIQQQSATWPERLMICVV